MWAKLHMGKKRFLYTICFFVFCLIDQRIKTASGLDGWLETFRELTGVVMAVLILSHYHFSDFKKRKIPYLVWSLFCVIGGAFFVLRGQSVRYFMNNRIVLVLGVFLFGIVLLHTFFELVSERKRPQLDKRFAALWLLMLVLMAVSRSEYRWPAVYLVMFGCFYLTDYTREEREDLFQGMLNGIILGFFLMQGWCFVFRPYDAIRYVGVYSNCNLNALFYLVVLAAVLTKLLYVYRAECSRWIKLYYWLGTGTVLAFLFLTISRTGWMTAAVLVFVTLLFLRTVTAHRSFFKYVIKNGLLVVLCFCLTLPLVFGAVRYLPPAFHHPVWFFGEWNENKVHSWDKWDSEKFVNPDRFLRTVSNRLTPIVEALFDGASGDAETTGEQEAVGKQEAIREQESAGQEAQGTAAVQSDTKELQVSPLQQQLYDEAFAAGYAIDPADRKNSLLVRSAIYRYYAHLLNFRGHPGSEQGFQITPDHNIGHAHNIYLQYGVDFGVPVMLLFILLIVWSAVGFVKQFRAEKSEQPAGCLLFLLVPAVFGLLEYCWGAGSLTITLLFVIWRRMIRNERES